MFTTAILAARLITASHTVAVEHGQDNELPQDVASAIAERVLSTSTTDDETRTIAGAALALAWYETGGQLVNDPRGSNDGGRSHCWAQVYLPNGARTAEGWTGAELRASPIKCATVGVRLIYASVRASPTCDGCGLTVYARGRDTAQGRALSRTRMRLAARVAMMLTP